MWHGTSESIALKIASNGFVNVKFNPSDKGYFGSGIYVTPQPRYAAAYVTGKSLLVSGWVVAVCTLCCAELCCALCCVLL